MKNAVLRQVNYRYYWLLQIFISFTFTDLLNYLIWLKRYFNMWHFHLVHMSFMKKVIKCWCFPSCWLWNLQCVFNIVFEPYHHVPTVKLLVFINIFDNRRIHIHYLAISLYRDSIKTSPYWSSMFGLYNMSPSLVRCRTRGCPSLVLPHIVSK